MRAAAKRNGPRAGATARKAKLVASGKPTLPTNAIGAFDANTFASAWVARRYRVRSRWAGIIADAAGLGGAAMSGPRMELRAVGPQGAFMVKGQTAKALIALIKAGASGITALEVNSWAYRLGAYVHDLRRRHGLAIETQREGHEGGWHGRYVLRSAVTLREPVS